MYQAPSRVGDVRAGPSCLYIPASLIQLLTQRLRHAFPHCAVPFSFTHCLPLSVSRDPPFPAASWQGCARCSHGARLAHRALPCREGSLKVGDRLLSVDGIPLHGASHATALATLRQCSHEALFQVAYDVAIPGESGPED